MTHIFYLLLFIFIYYEISVIGNAERIVKRVEEYKNTPKDEKSEYLSQNNSLVSFLSSIYSISHTFLSDYSLLNGGYS